MNKAFRKLARPYVVWLYLLAIVPILVMFVLAFVKSEGISFSESQFSLDAFTLLFDKATLVSIANSFFYAFIATVIALVLGYFVSYQLFKSKIRNKLLVLTLFILPMWSNLLLRTEALGNIMEQNNIVTNILSNVGISVGLNLKGSVTAVVIGLVLTYLPFVILPCYTALEKVERQHIEASLDLGCTNMRTFWKVIFPISSKGLVTASILVFLPSVTGFAVPKILGKGNILFIGNLIEQSFNNMNYAFGSLLSVLILVLILGALFIVNKVDKDGESLL